MEILSYFEKLVSLIKKHADFDGFYKSRKGISKHSFWAMGGTAVGGFFGGPVGAFFGGMAGSAIHYIWAEEYTAPINILMNLSFPQKERIVLGVIAIVGCALVASLVVFMAQKKNREKVYDFLLGGLAFAQ